MLEIAYEKPPPIEGALFCLTFSAFGAVGIFRISNPYHRKAGSFVCVLHSLAATVAVLQPPAHRWRAIGTPPRLRASCVENHAGERLGEGIGSPLQHWPRAGYQILFAILHFPSDPFTLRSGVGTALPRSIHSLISAPRRFDIKIWLGIELIREFAGQLMMPVGGYHLLMGGLGAQGHMFDRGKVVGSVQLKIESGRDAFYQVRYLHFYFFGTVFQMGDDNAVLFLCFIVRIFEQIG